MNWISYLSLSFSFSYYGTENFRMSGSSFFSMDRCPFCQLNNSVRALKESKNNEPNQWHSIILSLSIMELLEKVRWFHSASLALPVHTTQVHICFQVYCAHLTVYWLLHWLTLSVSYKLFIC